MHTKQNILIVHNYYQIPGGEDTVVANEKMLLEEKGHRVVLYSKNNSELSSMKFTDKLLLPIATIFNVKTYKEIKKIIRENNIDIVHVHNTLNLISASVYYAAKACGIPVVQTIHNFRLLCPGATLYRKGKICEDCIHRGLNSALKHNCYRNSKIQTLACVCNLYFHRFTGIYKKINYITLTEFNKEVLLNLKQIDSKQVYIKPNFVKSNNIFYTSEQRKNQIIFAGRLDELKGIEILLKAWEKFGETAPKLIICGTGPKEAWCKSFIEGKNLNAEMLGFVDNKEVLKLIAVSKALILPTQWYEGFPMSIVESYSVGTPVICSNIGNAGSIVKESVTGTKFKFNDVDDLIRAVNRCDDLYKSTLAEYKRFYTQEINYEMLMKIYDAVCIQNRKGKN